MNIIDAWKKAKPNQQITSKSLNWTLLKGVKLSRHEVVAREETLLADDWEVVREHKKIETTYREFFQLSAAAIPGDAKIVIEWEL